MTRDKHRWAALAAVFVLFATAAWALADRIVVTLEKSDGTVQVIGVYEIPPGNVDPPVVLRPAAVGGLTAVGDEFKASLSWTHDGANLGGFDVSWTGPGPNDHGAMPTRLSADDRTATVTQLPPGEYVFYVTAAGLAPDLAAEPVRVPASVRGPPVVVSDPYDELASIKTRLNDSQYAYLIATFNSDGTVKTLGRVPLFALTKGSYTLPSDAVPVPAGTDLSKLVKGKRYALADGDYGPIGDGGGKEFYAKNRGKARVRGKSGTVSASGVVTAFGLWFDGGGTSTKLNDNAAVQPVDGSQLIGCAVTNAIGVGIGCNGAKITLRGNLAHHNGSAGIGGKGDDGTFEYNVAYDNNDVVHDGDGATFGKWTRTNRARFYRNVAIGGACTAAFWWDINNGPNTLIENLAFNIRKIKQNFEGVCFKFEISCPGWTLTGNRAERQYGPAISIGETKKFVITNNYLSNGTGPQQAVLTLRQLTRSDEAQKADHMGDWHLGDTTFDLNYFLDGSGIVTKSNAGTKLTQQLIKSWGIVLGSRNAGTLDVRF